MYSEVRTGTVSEKELTKEERERRNRAEEIDAWGGE